MKKKNKHLKEKSKRFKEYKKKKSYTNLKNDIKNLPQEIQMLIFMITISAANSDNFNYHKPKFYKTLKCLNIHFDNKTKIETKDGVWYNNNGDYVDYSFKNNICERLVIKDQTKLLAIRCTDQQMYSALHNFELPTHRNYRDTGSFWFHEKCRCKDCDKIKLYALKNDKIIRQSQKYEYDLYKKDGATHSISGMKYYNIEREDIYPTHKKMYKDLKFNYDGSWKSRPTFLEKIKYEPYDIFEVEHFILSWFNVSNRYLF
jgi:hypothetical protein